MFGGYSGVLKEAAPVYSGYCGVFGGYCGVLTEAGSPVYTGYCGVYTGYCGVLTEAINTSDEEEGTHLEAPPLAGWGDQR